MTDRVPTSSAGFPVSPAVAGGDCVGTVAGSEDVDPPAAFYQARLKPTVSGLDAARLRQCSVFGAARNSSTSKSADGFRPRPHHADLGRQRRTSSYGGSKAPKKIKDTAPMIIAVAAATVPAGQRIFADFLADQILLEECHVGANAGWHTWFPPMISHVHVGGDKPVRRCRSADGHYMATWLHLPKRPCRPGVTKTRAG